ncbi:MAG: hypothetical protein PHG83_02185 [Patescibacteria group bacterium]|nr:hypothetical protein [Patescibacteria group bacterium]
MTEIFRREKEIFPKDESLEKLFGENFNSEKTIKLNSDLDENNQPKELGNYEARWTELKNPDTGEIVEGKVYLPKGTKNFKEVLIIDPGYHGDFVVQEAKYADDFACGDRAVVVLRHNGIRIEGEDVKSCIHCSEKTDYAQEKNQKYIGKDEDFKWSQSDREVLTALKSLEVNIDQLDKIDVLGYSWGGRIALTSLMDLKEEMNGLGEKAETAKKIADKIKNVVLMGAWVENRPEVINSFREPFKSEAEGNYFKNLNVDETIDSMHNSGKRLRELTADKLPENLRIVGIHSIKDQDIDLEGETLPFFQNQLKGLKKKGSIILKDLKELLPEKIGGREPVVHDYPIDQVRGWIKEVIKKRE